MRDQNAEQKQVTEQVEAKTQEGSDVALTVEQRAKITAKLVELAKGMTRGGAITALKDSPHSSHNDNDGWI